MITELKNIRDRIASISITQVVDNILQDYSDEIIAVLQTQMSFGKDGDGKNITLFGNPFYHPETIARKQGRTGIAGIVDHVTLFDTGDFYFSIYMEIEGESFKFKSDIFYFEDIIKKTGTSVMRLNKTSLKIIREDIILPQLKQRLSGI